MSEGVFSIPHLNFHVSRSADESISWHGSYEGKQVKRALPLDQYTRCIILLDPFACKKGAFKNLLCLESTGRVIWTAQLPQTHDRFIEIQMSSNEVIAFSWSGFKVALDPQTGRVLHQEFVK